VFPHQYLYKFVFGTCTALYRPVQACTSRKTLQFARLTGQVCFLAITVFFDFARLQFSEAFAIAKG
jgi:hypothetical protein